MSPRITQPSAITASVLAARGELERRQRQFEGARHAHDQQPRRLAAVRGPGARRALDQLIDQRRVEARRDDRRRASELASNEIGLLL